MPRKLTRLGPAYVIEGRTLERSGADVELLETVQVRLSIWKEHGIVQRWISLELLGGSRRGLETFVPMEAIEGEAVREHLHVPPETIIE